MYRWILPAATLVGAAVIAVVLLATAAPTPASAAGPPATTIVTAVDLQQTVQVSGTLSYGTPQGMIAAQDHGTLTWMASMGATVTLGQAVYRVDEKPVVLLHGTVPLYRDLHPGMSGADVAEVEASLAALGRTGFTVDDTFTASTAAAVAGWQRDLGVLQTGVIGPADAFVAPGDIRIALHGVAVGVRFGSDANATVMTYSATTRTVTVALDVAKQAMVAPRQQATVMLPGGMTVTATVQTVSTVADPGDPKNPAVGATIPVVLDVADQQALGTLDAAPVGVTLVTGSRTGVLAVPVAALLALPGGGYGVQVVAAGTAHVAPVTTGMFAAGKVEITGVPAGTVVGVPA